MNRMMTVASSLAVLVTVAACSRSGNAYDSTAGATTGAMATPPSIGMSTGATTSIGLSTGATTLTDTTKKGTKSSKKPY